MSRKPSVRNSHPVVVDVTGKVLVKGKGQSAWEPVERGTLVLSGDVIRTGTKGRARINFSSGKMDLYEDTEVQIPTIGTMERKKDLREVVVRNGSALIAVGVDGDAGRFRFRSGNVRGQAAGSILTVSYRGAGTAVNVYDGEAQVSHADTYGEKTSGLVPGSSLMLGNDELSVKVRRFDPGAALENYRKDILPHLDAATGLNANSAPHIAQNERVKAALPGFDESEFDDSDRAWSGNSREDKPSDGNSVVADVDLPGEENEGETGLPGVTDGVSGIVKEAVPYRSPDVR